MKFYAILVLSFLSGSTAGSLTAQEPKPADLYAPDNLMAWCIVPFDSKKRGPEERAGMLERLGLRRLAYDWRAEHVPTFDAEVEAMQRHRIEITAWWFPGALDADARAILGVIERHRIHPQLWVTGGGTLLQPGKEHAARIEAEAERIRPIVTAAARLGCQVGLYNHGGWFGEPENQLDVITRLETDGLRNVGIVYNFHHGHAHLPRFGELVRKMKPRLLAVNLNGMVRDGEQSGRKILTLGAGDQDLEMLRVLQASGWKGPVGIIDHRPETDSEQTLSENLRGLAWLRAELNAPGSGGKRPGMGPAQPGSSLPPAPAAFFPDALPLHPENHPWHLHPVNRDRIYDFYAKQARRFAAVSPMPALVPSYPGLDGGRHGHWGNQNEEIWRDARWNDMDAGGLQCGIVAIDGKTIPRAVCVQLGDQRELSACFNSETLTWEAVWKGPRLLRSDSFRWGMLHALVPDGQRLPAPASASAAPGSFTWHGFYRQGKKVLFAFAKDGAEWLETAWVENGSFVRSREKAGGILGTLAKGGAAQWPQILESKGQTGSGSPFAVDTLTFPPTPWKSLWHVGGHDFLPNGAAALCTFEGEVWMVSGIDAGLERLRWKRFASGLNQPLGLKVVDGKICLLCRDQLTRLHDFNGDGEADFYECLSRAFETPVGGHDYLTGLETDAEGRFYFASGKGGILRLSIGRNSVETLATGFRNPNGLAVGPQGKVVAAAQEGDWTAASLLAEIVPGGHYRHGGPRPGPLGNLPPTIYFPRGVDNSCGGQVFCDSDRWGLPEGSLVHLSWGTGTALLVLLESLDGQTQGCAVPLPGEFRSGAHRGRFRPQDGHLYVAGCTGWGTYTPEEGCFERLRWTGAPVQAPVAVYAHENGLRFDFPTPLDPSAARPEKWFAQQWNYLIGPAYGSDEYSVRWPSTPGHDVLKVESVHLLGSGTAVFLEIPQLLPCHQLHVHGEVPGFVSQDFFLTLHRLGQPFAGYPGYKAVAKHLPGHAAGTAQEVQPSAFEKGIPGRAIKIQTAAGLVFAQKELHARAGEQLSLTLENPDLIAHNWVLGTPGSMERIADLADRALTDPAALSRSYVPQCPEVLCHTRLVEAGRSITIHFQAPLQKGDYPFLCTFPGHTRIMRGVLHVE
ncbi:MAG: heme-binding domain-containing protein [Verrucomicrobiales bacterium]|nr:heme-binding domain-containing protein [Verrucomicrobiales bacterium]